MKKTLFAWIFFLPPALQGQTLQVVASGGQHLTDNRYVLTATIGETCVLTCTGDAQYVSEGFQQGFPAASDEVPAGARAPEPPAFHALISPNPATDHIQISLQHAGGQPVRLQVFNRLGALIEDVRTTSDVHLFNLASYPAGYYWLAIRTSEKPACLSLPFEKINF